MSDAVHQLRPGNVLSTANESSAYQSCVSDAMFDFCSSQATILTLLQNGRGDVAPGNRASPLIRIRRTRRQELPTGTLKAPKSFHDIASNTDVPYFLHHVELTLVSNTPEQPHGALKLAYTAPNSASLQATSSRFHRQASCRASRSCRVWNRVLQISTLATDLVGILLF